MGDAQEYERSYAGLVLDDEAVLYDTPLDIKHFRDPIAREVIRVANELIVKGEQVNLVTVADASKTLASRAADLANTTSGAVKGSKEFYERKIISAYKSRELSTLSMEIRENLDDPDGVLAMVDRRIAEITSQGERDRIYTAGELINPAIKIIEKRYHGKGELPGIATGFPALDKITAGLQANMLYYIGARPSQGKSAILLNIANHTALHDVSTGIISAESSKEELIFRSFSNVASIDSYSIKTGLLKPADFASISSAGAKLYGKPLYIYDVPNITIARLIAVAKAMHRKYKIRLLMVDYVQLIVSMQRNAPRRDQVAEISTALKNLARELQIPVVAAAQLTRDSEDTRPSLRHFAEASQIEKDADVAILLQHVKDEAGNTTRVWAHVEKNRDGSRGSVPLQFVGKYVRFAEEARHDVV